MIIRCIQY